MSLRVFPGSMDPQRPKRAFWFGSDKIFCFPAFGTPKNTQPKNMILYSWKLILLPDKFETRNHYLIC